LGQSISEREPLKGKLKIKNTGDKQLVIQNVKPTCGCTTAPLKKDKLNPGESTEVDVTLNIGNNSGPVRKSIKIYSNDPKSPLIHYALAAEVVRPIEIKPQSFMSFQDMQIAKESSSSLTLENTSDKDIVIENIELKPENLMLNIKKGQVLKAGQSLELIVKVRPQKAGRFTARIMLTTSHPDYRELRINGFGNVMPSPLFNSK
jgi:hypothetical protein